MNSQNASTTVTGSESRTPIPSGLRRMFRLSIRTRKPVPRRPPNETSGGPGCSHLVKEPVDRRVAGLLPLGQAIPDSAAAEVDIDRLRRPSFDGGDRLRRPRQRAVCEFRDERFGRLADRGLPRPAAKARHTHQATVSDASFQGRGRARNPQQPRLRSRAAARVERGSGREPVGYTRLRTRRSLGCDCSARRLPIVAVDIPLGSWRTAACRLSHSLGSRGGCPGVGAEIAAAVRLPAQTI